MKKFIRYAMLAVLLGLLYSSALAVTCPTVTQSLNIATGVGNYGCFDGTNFWVPDSAGTYIYKISADATTYTAYVMNDVIQMAFDGTYIWALSYDYPASLRKIDPSSGDAIYFLYPEPGSGNGQSIVYDGTSLWVGIADTSSGGEVARVNPTTYATELRATGQTNVNGICVGYDRGQEYIFAACTGFFSKINATTGTYITKIDFDQAYRIAVDDSYVYTASFSRNTVYVCNITDLTPAVSHTWPSGKALNDILSFGNYIWVCGNDSYTTIHDKTNNGSIVCSIPSSSYSGMIYGDNNVLGINATQVNLISGGLGPTSTPDMSNTPYETPTNTPFVTITSTPIIFGTATRTPFVTATFPPYPSPITTASVAPSKSFTLTPTLSWTLTPTLTWTLTPTLTVTLTKTIIPSNTPYPSFTASPVNTGTYTFTSTITLTLTVSMTPTVTQTSQNTATVTVSPTLTIISTPYISVLAIDIDNAQYDVKLECPVYPADAVFTFLYGVSSYDHYTSPMDSSWNESISADSDIFTLAGLPHGVTEMVKLRVDTAEYPYTQTSAPIQVYLKPNFPGGW